MSEGRTFTWLGAVVIIGWLAIAALVIFLWGCTAPPRRGERVIYRLTVNGKLVEERVEETTVEPIDPNRKDKPCE